MPTSSNSNEPQKNNRQALTVVALAAAVLGVAAYVWWSANDRPINDGRPDKKLTGEPEMAGRVRNLLAAGQREQARDAAILYVQSHPDDVVVRCLLAKALWSLGQADDARRVLADVDKLSPSQAQALWLHGEMAKASGEADYMKYFAQAVNQPTVEAEMNSLYAIELLSRGDDEQARKYLQRSINAGLADSPTLQAQAQLAIKAGRYPEAISHLQAALKLDRANAACWRLLAQAQRQSNQVEQAAQTLQDALKACRDKTGLYFEMGNVRSSQSQPAQAADAFAMAADPEALSRDQRLEAAVSAAINYYQVGRYALAMKYIDLASSLEASDSRVKQWMPKIEDARFGAQQGEK